MAKIVNTSQANAGDPVEATLDKNELKSISKVANDPVFSQESNWGLVSCIFKHKDSSRRFVAAFRSSETKIMNLKPNMLAGDNFEIKKIIIAKPNREMLVIRKSEIPSYEDYDFTLKSGNAVTVNYINYNLLYGDVTTDAQGAVTCPSGDPGNVAKSTTKNYANSDFSFTFEIAPTLTYGFFCGISDSNSSSIGSYSFGIASYGNSNTVCAYQVNGPASPDITLLPNGNSVKIEKANGNLYFYVNQVLIHSLLGANVPAAYPCVRPMAGTPVISSSLVVPAALNYVVYDNLSEGASTDGLGGLYKSAGGSSPKGVSNTAIGQFNGTYDISFIIKANAWGVTAGLAGDTIGNSGLWVRLIGGTISFRDSNGGETSLGSFNTVADDVTVKMVFNAQTVQILLDGVEILAPTALYAGYSPTDLMYPCVRVSHSAPYSQNVNTGFDIVKESFYNS
jgi:hypothetical protein